MEPAPVERIGRRNQAAVPSALTDTQIAKILQTINEGEIDAAKIAEKNALSRSLEAEAKQSNKGLKQQSAANFYQAYIAERVSIHAKALTLLEGTLIPAAQNAEP